MNYSDFYTFGSKLISTTLQVHPQGLDSESWSDLTSGMLKNIEFPVHYKHKYGKKHADLLNTGTVELYVVSQKLVDLFEKCQVSGWTTYPVVVKDKKGNDLKGYHGLSICGRCGPMDYGKSKVFEKQLAPNAPVTRMLRGLYFGYDEWDGSDVFIAEDSFFVIVTKKVVEVVREGMLSNIKLKCLPNIEVPEFTFKN